MSKPHPASPRRTRSVICGHRGGPPESRPRMRMRKARDGETRYRRIAPGPAGHENRGGWVSGNATYVRPRGPRPRCTGRRSGTRTMDVDIVASQAVTADVDIVRLEPIVFEQRPKDPPRRS